MRNSKEVHTKKGDTISICNMSSRDLYKGEDDSFGGDQICFKVEALLNFDNVKMTSSTCCSYVNPLPYKWILGLTYKRERTTHYEGTKFVSR